MTTKIPIIILNIENEGFHLLINVKINNKKASLIVDTGASSTVLDKEKIKKFADKKKFIDNDKLSTGLGTSSMKSKKTILEKIIFGTLEVKKYPTLLLDLSHVNKSYKSIGLKPIDGILGSDLLLKYNAIIDYKKKILILTKSSSKK
ncbi:MAG: retropepsin-like aspartic protease [Bacteroidia bacterium]